MTKSNQINGLQRYEFDAFSGTFLTSIYAENLPLSYHDKDPNKTIVPLLEYIQDLEPFTHTKVATGKGLNGYAHATELRDSLDDSLVMTICYGGRNQNGTIAVRVLGSQTNRVYPALARHFQFRVTRLDAAINYQGDYKAIQRVLCQITDTPDPKHLGNDSGGHTHYFGSRTSTTMIRHYQYGKHHFPLFEQWHDENRIEVEWKPKDKAQQVQAQSLTAEQVFARSRAGQKIQEYLHGQSAKLRLVSSRRTPQTDMEERLRRLAIQNRHLIRQAIAGFGGDIEQLGLFMCDAITEHEKRASR